MYQLLDSGEGAKLERFGERIVARPSSLCIWKRRLPASAWKKADATFVPGKDEESGGWRFGGAPFESWKIDYLTCVIELKLLRNGQVGLFPEHASYLSQLESLGVAPTKEAPRLLNLFAYTGLATVYFAKRGWSVTHVDLSKKALSWAQQNISQNDISEKAIRLMCDDAIKFIEREVRRGATYEGIIADPPSFSRTAKGKFWKLEDMLHAVVSNCAALMSPHKSWFAISCHHPGISAEMLANLLRDLGRREANIEPRELSVPEHDSDRVLPAGSFALLAT